MFGVVTMRLILLTRWWTWVSFFFYGCLSIGVYIACMWLQEIGIPDETLIYHSAKSLHQSGIFWLTVLLIVGTSFMADCLVEFINLEFFTSGSDYVRKFVYMRKDGDKGIKLEEKDLADIK